jgi:hypothetical protein
VIVPADTVLIPASFGSYTVDLLDGGEGSISKTTL